jgi:hypothetical protein
MAAMASAMAAMAAAANLSAWHVEEKNINININNNVAKWQCWPSA